MDKDIQQLLGWYVNGTLVGPDRDRVEDALAGDAAGARLIDWERAVRNAVRNDTSLEVAADRGLSQVMQRIRQQAPSIAPAKPMPTPKRANVAVPRSATAEGMMGRLREWINWSPGLAFACTIIAVQFVAIGQMWSTKEDEAAFAELRAVEPQSRGDTFVRIMFKPDTTERQISAMLRSNNAEIVAGPSQLGDYYLLVPPNDGPKAIARMLGNAQVESAEIVNALPTRP